MQRSARALQTLLPVRPPFGIAIMRAAYDDCNSAYRATIVIFGILTKPYLSHIMHLLMNAFAAVHDGTITAASQLIPMTPLYPSGCCPSAPKYDAARRTVQH